MLGKLWKSRSSSRRLLIASRGSYVKTSICHWSESGLRLNNWRHPQAASADKNLIYGRSQFSMFFLYVPLSRHSIRNASFFPCLGWRLCSRFQHNRTARRQPSRERRELLLSLLSTSVRDRHKTALGPAPVSDSSFFTTESVSTFSYNRDFYELKVKII